MSHNRADIKWGSSPLNILEHPTPLIVGAAFVIVIALQDVNLSAGLITAVLLCGLEGIGSMALKNTGRLKHWSYALNHCFFWPFLTWLVVHWWDKPSLGVEHMRFHEWMGPALWGGVATLMSINILLGYPWPRDMLKDKSPATAWDLDWWDELALNIARVWVLIFTVIFASALVPMLTHKWGTSNAINVIFNYIVPILAGVLGTMITQWLVDRTQSMHVYGAGGSGAAGTGSASMYEPLVRGQGAEGGVA